MSVPTEIDDKPNNLCTIKGHLFLFHLRFIYNLCGKVPFLDKKKPNLGESWANKKTNDGESGSKSHF
ncbi:hypothetical protein [Acinetobacter sp. YH01009]|uniref:hypothetical protein n=1 Tax=Acinetobacter sp. YH01009 TaxID=2601025 RepID=UPI0015D133C1|nr:hypothetical protein [Acinetobacter sp. YH01009]